MRRPRSTPARAGLTLAALTVALGTSGCWAVYNAESDIDRTPVVNTGAGASVIYPGQSAPPHPGNYHPREAGYGQGAATTPAPQGAGPVPPSAPPGATPAPSVYGSDPRGTPPPPTPAPPPPTGVAAHLPPGAVGAGVAQPPPEYASRGARQSGGGASGTGITMIGGAETDETRHVKVSEEPTWLKYVGLPFAVLAAPFEWGAEKAAGDPEPAPAVPRLEDQPRPVHGAPAATDYEAVALRDLERELAMRETPPRGATAPPATVATAPPGPPRSGFAEELAALRRRTPTPSAGPGTPPLPPPTAPRPAATSGEVDRDGDGRSDHWIEREAGAIVRERFDEDFDGRPDRTLVYDPVTHEVVRIDEDTDFDGRLDTWTAFRSGQVVGRRADSDGDGRVDTWSRYRDGVVTRLERDADGDGFRDHVAFYRDGRLAREERDDDGDGRTDLVKYFDAGERVERVEEDADGDGEMDVVSHYEGGRLTRREVLDTSVLGLGQPPRSGVN